MCEKILQTRDLAKCSLSIGSRSWITQEVLAQSTEPPRSDEILRRAQLRLLTNTPDHILCAWPRLSAIYLSASSGHSNAFLSSHLLTDKSLVCSSGRTLKITAFDSIRLTGSTRWPTGWWECCDGSFPQCASRRFFKPWSRDVLFLCSSRLSFRSWVLTRWRVSWGGQGATWRNVWWKCC